MVELVERSMHPQPGLTALRTTTIRVPISRGVEDISFYRVDLFQLTFIDAVNVYLHQYADI